MRKSRAFIAASLCASLASPAPAQVRAVAPVFSGAVPRVMVAPLALTASAPSAFLLSAPALLAAPLAIAAPISGPVSAAGTAPVAPAVLPVRAEPPVAAPVVLAAASAARSLPPAPDAGPAPASPEEERALAESFWSGAALHDGDPASMSAPVRVPAKTSVSIGASLKAAAALPAVAPALVPAAVGFKALLVQASPFLEAAAVLVGTYAANRVARWIIGKLALKKGLDRHQIAVARLVIGVALWSAAAAGAMHLGGASPEAIKAVFGAGGTILSLAMRDIMGNLIHGINFLITRPYTVGDRIQIDGSAGTVADLTLTSMHVDKDDGSEVKVRYATLAAKPVVLLGEYSFPDAALSMHAPRVLGLRGVGGALWGSLDRGLLLAAALFTGLLFAPGMIGIAATGWSSSLLTYAAAASAAWLTRRIELFLVKTVERLAAANSWRLESRVIALLAARAFVWALGGGAILMALGVSWTTLAASLGLTTLGVGLASNNFFSTVVQGGAILFEKPFKVGDTLELGSFKGVVEDITLYHVVVKLDEGRHVLLPYAVVRDAAIIVTPKETHP